MVLKMSKLDKIKEHPPSAVLKSERQEYKTLHNIPKPPSLRARYFALSLLALPPIIVGWALLWCYMQPANGLLYVLLP